MNLAKVESKPSCPKKSEDEIARVTNPFLIFFLKLRSKKPNVSVKKVASIAGKRWKEMTAEERQKYIDLANAEKKRRESVKKKKVKPPSDQKPK